MKISVKLLLVFAGAVWLVVVQGLIDHWSSSEIKQNLVHVKSAVLQQAQAADGMMEAVAKLESVMAVADSATPPMKSSEFRDQGAAVVV